MGKKPDKVHLIQMTEEKRMAPSPQSLKGPEGRFGDRIYWRDNWPIKILPLNIALSG